MKSTEEIERAVQNDPQRLSEYIDEIKDHGFTDIVLDEEYEGDGDGYKFVK